MGVFPRDAIVNDLARIQDSLDGIFFSQDIPIKWTEQERLHVTILSLGSNLNPIVKLYNKYLVEQFVIKPFGISFGRPKIGISNRYRELVYLPVENGADELRELLLSFAKHMHYKREHSFIPHITLGRVSKDLSEQEYRNIKHEIDGYSKITLPSEFSTEDVRLIESDIDRFEIRALPKVLSV